MRKLSIVILMFMILAIAGCKSAPEETAAPQEQAVPPTLRQVDEVPQEEPVQQPPEPVQETKVVTPPPISNRIEGEVEQPVEEDVSAGVEEVKLLADKTMSVSELTVKVGTTLAWKNYDTWPHQIQVVSGKGLDTKLWGKSERLLEGGVWEYAFSEPGTYLAKDTFSGTMRMNVTVD